MAAGECRIFERPEHVILGKKQPDQDWIDSSIEGGIGGCGWQRPLPRPPEWDNAPAPRQAVAAKRQRVGIIKRIKQRVFGPRPPARPTVLLAPPVLPSAPVMVALSPPLPAPPPKPVDPADELLGIKR